MNRWILLDSDWYGESMWEEKSSLYWCGGDWYAIVYQHEAYKQEGTKVVTLLHKDAICSAWERETSLYETYRNNA